MIPRRQLKDRPEGNAIESKYMAVAAGIGFLLAPLLTHGSLVAAFGTLALIAGVGWVAHRLWV